MSKIDHLIEHKKSTIPSFNQLHNQENIKLKYLLSNQLDSDIERIPFLKRFKSIIINIFWSKLFDEVRDQAINSAYMSGKSDAYNSICKEVKDNLHIIREYKIYQDDEE